MSCRLSLRSRPQRDPGWPSTPRGGVVPHPVLDVRKLQFLCRLEIRTEAKTGFCSVTCILPTGRKMEVFSSPGRKASRNLAPNPDNIAWKGSERSITHPCKRLRLPKSTRMGASRTKCIDKPAILGDAAAIEQLSRLSKSWHRRQT
jgi:hypothetical protein